jgi:hypothetical protein
MAAPAALADGDPASDVLVDSTFFNPIDSGIPADSPAMVQLDATLAAASKAGFPIRVALIATPTDLGTASALWQQPRSYAYFLWYELSNLYDGQVLIVMPNNKYFGLWGPATGPHEVTAAERAVEAPTPRPGLGLAESALAAVPLLAKADGHPIATADLHLQTAAASKTATAMPLSAWLALLIGALLIVLAWRASIRARPLGLSRKAHP